jgi:hypothetical protein
MQEILRQTASRGCQTPACKTKAQDQRAIASIRPTRKREGCGCIEDREGGPAQSAQRCVANAQILLDRLHENAEHLTVDHAGDTQHRQQQHRHMRSLPRNSFDFPAHVDTFPFAAAASRYEPHLPNAIANAL